MQPAGLRVAQDPQRASGRRRPHPADRLGGRRVEDRGELDGGTEHAAGPVGQERPPALGLAAVGAKGIVLVKPQFEAGREAIGKGGIVRDETLGPRISEDLRGWLDAVPGWRAVGLCPSPIEGSDGNREFLLAGSKDR